MKDSITIYSKPGCPYCIKAKTMLAGLNLKYKEIQLNPNDPDYVQKRDTLFNYYSHRSYPIILVGKNLIGGYSELVHSYDTLRFHKLCSDIGIHVPFDF